MGTSDQYKVFDSILDWSPTLSIVLGPPGVPISLKSVFLETPCSVRFSNLNFQVDVVVTIVSEFDSGENKSNWLVGDKTVFYGGGDDQG